MDDNRFLDTITSNRTVAFLLGAVLVLLLTIGTVQTWMQ